MADTAPEMFNKLRRSSNDEYRYPSITTIQGLGGMDRDAQSLLLDESRAAGAKDALEGVLLGHAVRVPTRLNTLLRTLAQAMGDVVHVEDQIQNHVSRANAALLEEAEAINGVAQERLTPAQEEDEGAVVGHLYISATPLEEARYAHEAARMDAAAFRDAGSRSRAVLVIALIAALAGIFVDSLMLGAAIGMNEEYSDAQSLILGFAIAVVLGSLAATSGVLYARGRPGGRIANDKIPKSVIQRHSAQAERDHASHRINLIGAALLAIALIVVIAVLWVARLATWVDYTDSRSGARYIQIVIIILALLSLIVFWFEGFEVGLKRRHDDAAQRLAWAEVQLDELADLPMMARTFEEQMKLNETDIRNVGKINSDIGKAVRDLVPLHGAIVETYIHGAVAALGPLPESDPRRSQIDDFQELEQRVPELLHLVSVDVSALFGLPSAQVASQQPAGGAS
ncbi:MAG: hypothetical protein WCF36_21050 [Candidatus Nanopelagicales bacterium]